MERRSLAGAASKIATRRPSHFRAVSTWPARTTLCSVIFYERFLRNDLSSLFPRVDVMTLCLPTTTRTTTATKQDEMIMPSATRGFAAFARKTAASKDNGDGGGAACGTGKASVENVSLDDTNDEFMSASGFDDDEFGGRGRFDEDFGAFGDSFESDPMEMSEQYPHLPDETDVAEKTAAAAAAANEVSESMMPRNVKNVTGCITFDL